MQLSITQNFVLNVKVTVGLDLHGKALELASRLLMCYITSIYSLLKLNLKIAGLETSPWDLSANREIHVIANVSIAIQNWLCLNVTPNGHAWYENKGRIILNSIAAFWASRLEFSPEKDAYVIKGWRNLPVTEIRMQQFAKNYRFLPFRCNATR